MNTYSMSGGLDILKKQNCVKDGKRKMSEMREEKIVIIGGGIAGLTAGIYARLAGFKAQIFEKNAIPGGECIGWNRKGYHIDNCIHWLTGTRKDTEMYKVWKTTGALSDDTEYAKVDAFYSSSYQGQTVTLWNDLDKTQKELIAISPEDEDEIKKFIQNVEYSKQCLFPAGKPMEMWGIKDYIEMGKNMMDFPKVMKEFGKISLEEYAKRFHSPLLQKMICDYLPPSYAAYSFLVSYATMADGNGKIPMGASLQMSLRMEKRFKELGGEIFYNQSISKIRVEKKRATGIELSDGRFVDADIVIPTVDTHVLFHKLLSEDYMPKELKEAYKEPAKYPVTSGFQVAYALDLELAPGETLFLEIDPLKVGAGKFNRMYVKSYEYDGIFNKDGKTVLQTCITQTDADFEYWKSLSSEQYKAEKEKMIAEVTKRIEVARPEMKGKLEFLDAWTPVTYERYCNAYHGSYMSFVTTPNGKQIKMKGQLKGIDNLYVAGQWTNSPGGLPVAAASGKFAIQRILKKQKRNIFIDQA